MSDDFDRRYHAVRTAAEVLDEAGYPDDAQAVMTTLLPPAVPEPEWVVRARRNDEIVKEATGVEGHAIRCGFAVLEPVGAHQPWTQENCQEFIGLPFIWLKWPNKGAIVAAEPCGDYVRVEVWAVP